MMGKKILVIRNDHIGDLVLSTPVYREIKKKYPKSKLYVAIRPDSGNVLENNPYVDKIIYLDSKFTNRSWNRLTLKERLEIYKNNIFPTDLDNVTTRSTGDRQSIDLLHPSSKRPFLSKKRR